MLGSALALLSAISFGLNSASVRRGILTGTTLQGMSISITIGVPLFFAVGALTGGFALLFDLPAHAIALLATAGVAHFIWGRYWNYRSLKAMGSNLTGPIQQLNVLFALVFAIWLLDEFLTPLRIIGILLILIGPVVMLKDRNRRARKPKAEATEFTPQLAAGITYSLLSILGFGSSSVLVRAAIADTGPVGGVTAGIVTYSAAAIVLSVALFQPRNMRHVLGMDGRTARWFTLSGLVVCFSQMFRFMALSIAPVAVVAPIQQTSSAFRVVFAWFINRDHESFGFWVLTGIFLSMLGAVALSVSTEIVLQNVPLPEIIRTIAQWEWP